MSGRALVAMAVALAVSGCGKRREGVEPARDAAAFERPSDHLGRDELVPKREDVLGLPLPQGFVKVEVQPGEEAAQGEATVEAVRRHVLEHTMNGVAKPEPGALVWWDAEIPGRGAARFEVRVLDDGRGTITIVVREQGARAAMDGGSGEVLRALGLDDRGYPRDYDKLR
jgi:hypothetical protein